MLGRDRFDRRRRVRRRPRLLHVAPVVDARLVGHPGRLGRRLHVGRRRLCDRLGCRRLVFERERLGRRLAGDDEAKEARRDLPLFEPHPEVVVQLDFLFRRRWRPGQRLLRPRADVHLERMDDGHLSPAPV